MPSFSPTNSSTKPRSLRFNAPETDEKVRRTLTRERVVTSALTLIAQKGVEALTMRALSARLGVVDYTLGFEVNSPRISVNEQRVQDAATRKRLHELFRSLPGDRPDCPRRARLARQPR